MLFVGQPYHKTNSSSWYINVWLRMMSGHGGNRIFFNKKKIKIGRQEFLLTPIPLSPITSHFFLIPPWKWMSWVYHPFCQNDCNEITSHVNVYNRLTRHRREIISFRPKWSYDRINLPPFSKQMKSYEVTTNRSKVSI